MGRKRKSSWSGGDEQVRRDLSVRRGKSAEDETNNSRTLSVQRLLHKKLAFGKEARGFLLGLSFLSYKSNYNEPKQGNKKLYNSQMYRKRF